MSASDVVGHALVVGCPGEGLRGVVCDVVAMADMLRARGFGVEVCAGEDATRDGILDEYDRLIARARPDLPAAFYYTGHGFYAYRKAEEKPWQGICPADIGSSTAEDFRGITAWELSIKLAQLTRRTQNVTLIFDCCHATLLTREGKLRGGVPRTLPHPIRVSFAAHLEALRAKYGHDFDAVDPAGNRDAVRLVACGQGETAFECEVRPGEYRGAFTDALLRIMNELGDVQVSWATLENPIRSRVFDRFPTQRPSVDGPARRLVFSLQEDHPSRTTLIVAVPGGFELGEGRLMGVSRGDVYGVMPPGCRSYCPGEAIAEIEVSEIFATTALATLRHWHHGHTALHRAAVGFPLERRPAAWAVNVIASDTAMVDIAAALCTTDTLRIAVQGELALATLHVAEDVLTIHDPISSLCHPLQFPGDLCQAMSILATLGNARRLREYEGEHGVAAHELAVEWGVVKDGAMRRMPERGAVLGLRDRVYVRVVSAAKRPLYVHVFNIGIADVVRMMTQNLAAAGVPLHEARSEMVLGRCSDGTLSGLPLYWPSTVPRAVPRVEELVVLVTTMPANLQRLETEDQHGGRRSVYGLAELDGYFAKRLSWILYPGDVEMAGTAAEFDHDHRMELHMRDCADIGEDCEG